jgi:hypothetical protein
MGEFTVVFVTRTCLRAGSLGAHSAVAVAASAKTPSPTGRNATTR